MSAIRKCSRCGGNIVEPAYEGDGAYPVAPMCSCDQHAAADALLPLCSICRRRHPSDNRHACE